MRGDLRAVLRDGEMSHLGVEDAQDASGSLLDELNTSLVVLVLDWSVLDCLGRVPAAWRKGRGENRGGACRFGWMGGGHVEGRCGVQRVLGLLCTEDESEEELLELLVGKVDRELLEGIVRAEELEAEDVEQAHEARILLASVGAAQGRVDAR